LSHHLLGCRLFAFLQRYAFSVSVLHIVVFAIATRLTTTEAAPRSHPRIIASGLTRESTLAELFVITARRLFHGLRYQRGPVWLLDRDRWFLRALIGGYALEVFVHEVTLFAKAPIDAYHHNAVCDRSWILASWNASGTTFPVFGIWAALASRRRRWYSNPQTDGAYSAQ